LNDTPHTHKLADDDAAGGFSSDRVISSKYQACNPDSGVNHDSQWNRKPPIKRNALAKGHSRSWLFFQGNDHGVTGIVKA
jgi:hypothetical protein